MARRTIAQLGEGENVNQVFLVLEKQMRANRQGSLYIQLRLADRTGSLTAMLWNANERMYAEFENGDYLQVQGTTQFYNGALQMIANKLERVDPTTVDEAEFAALGPVELDRLGARLAEILRSLSRPPLRNLADCFLMDEAFMARFSRAPAGIKNHHAYHGGLLQHVVGLMELVSSVVPHYEQLDRDVLILGAFLHDVGKIEELSYEREMSYSDAGQLIGHLVLGVGILEEKIREAEKLAGEPFPADLGLALKHIIVSHHGQYDFGSPKLPMTREAIALHYLDTLDAKLHQVEQLIREDPNHDSVWTTYQPNLGRKLYKGISEGGDEPASVD